MLVNERKYLYLNVTASIGNTIWSCVEIFIYHVDQPGVAPWTDRLKLQQRSFPDMQVSQIANLYIYIYEEYEHVKNHVGQLNLYVK